MGLAPFSDGTSPPGGWLKVMQKVDSGQEFPRSRVRVYIDGFNLYHAIAALKDTRLKWLNFWKLSETFLRPGEALVEVNFFTAVLTWNYDKQQRHVNFIKACETVGVNVHLATFKNSYKTCMSFDRECKFFEEKQTDVAIAVRLVSDALTGQFDRAILVTADSDQIPTVRFVAGLPSCKISLIFPPGRKSTARDLGLAIDDRQELLPGRMLTCLLPRTVFTASGKAVAHMPSTYLTPNLN